MKTCLRHEDDYYVKHALQGQFRFAAGNEILVLHENATGFGRDNGVIVVIGSPVDLSIQPTVELDDDSICFVVSGQPFIKKVSDRATIVVIPEHPGYHGQADYLADIPEEIWTDAEDAHYARIAKTEEYRNKRPTLRSITEWLSTRKRSRRAGIAA